MEPKKISFGFSKIQKKPNVLSATSVKEDNKVELIKCLEGQTIKLVEEKPKEEAKPLVIPMKESTRTAAALASLKARHDILNGIIAPQSDENNSDSKPKEVSLENETIEQRAARELLQSVTKTEENGTDDGKSAIAIPKPDELPLDGAKESTFDDYESTPITQFGYAMLRGMGWKDEPKSKDDKKDLMEPFVRPKGMGLGADKIAKPKPLLIPPDANETLEIKKNACVKILAGKHKDLYGQVEGFDDHAGRVIVKLALGGHFESLNEFLVQPVSKKEYAEYGKVINSAKYEEYKKLENAQGQIVLKTPKIEKTADSEIEDRKVVIKQEKNIPQPTSSRRYSTDSEEDVRQRYRSDGHRHETHTKRSEQRERRRSRSYSSSGQSSDDYRRTEKKKSSKSKKHKNRNRERSRDRSHHRCTSSEDEKRHKKKTKKSKRPRSRSRGRRR